MARPRTTPRDEAHARLLEQKRASHARHREENNRRQREWYHQNQCAVRAQQSRYREEANAWKYQPRTSEFTDITPDDGWKKFAHSTRWHGILGGPTDRLSIINEPELREPSYLILSPRRTPELEILVSEDPLNWIHNLDRKTL